MPAPHRAPARALSVLAALGLGLGLVAVPTPALAGERTDLPVTGAVDLVADETRDRLVIAQGRGSSELLVTDLAGTPTGRVPVTDAVDVAPDETRGWYWVAQAERHTLTAVDVETLEVVRTFDARTGSEDYTSCPDAAVPIGRFVAFSSSCDYSSGGEHLRVLDPETGVVTGNQHSSARGVTGPPAGAAPGSPLARSLWTQGSGGSGVVRWEVDLETGGYVAAASTPTDDPQRLVVAPDGSALVGTRGHRWDPLTLEPLAAYDLPPNRYDEPFEGLDVVFAPDGRAVFTSYGVAPVEPVWTVPAGSLEPGRTYDLRQELGSGLGIDAWRSPEAVAVGAVDTYVVSEGRDGFRLDVLSPGPDATLTLAEPATAYPYGARVRLPVQLDARSAERSLRVWTYGVNGGVVEGPAVTLAADGSGRIPVRLKKSTNVLVGYDAVDTSESVVTRARLMVSPRLTLGFPGARAGRVPAYAAGRAATIAVAVKGRPECVRILVERRTSADWRPLSRSACNTPRGGEVSAVLPWRADLRGAALRASVETRKDRFWAASAAGPERFTFR